MSKDWITTDDYKKILEKRYNKDDLRFLNVKLTPISENDEGFMGEHYNLKITFEDDGEEKQANFFVKTKPQKYAAQKKMITHMNCYDKEIFLYDFLFKEYAKYGFDTSFAANTFYCIRGDTLVLEDMTLRNFKVPERQTIYDMQLIKCLLKSLALFHGAGFAYEKVKSKELGGPFSVKQEYEKYINEIFFTMYTGGNSFGPEWFDSSKQSFETLIDQLPKDEEYKASFKKMLRDAKLGKIFADETNLIKTFGHGDLWSNNMLFRYENNVVQKCCLIDYQFMRYFYPAFDVVLAAHFNSDADFRAKHLKDMYQYYYDTLGDTLHNYGYKVEEILSKEDFYKSIDVCKMDALMQVATVNAMVFVKADLLTKAASANMKNETDTIASLDKCNSYLCTEAFNSDEKYRKIIMENLYDLYDALCERDDETNKL